VTLHIHVWRRREERAAHAAAHERVTHHIITSSHHHIITSSAGRAGTSIASRRGCCAPERDDLEDLGVRIDKEEDDDRAQQAHREGCSSEGSNTGREHSCISTCSGREFDRTSCTEHAEHHRQLVGRARRDAASVAPFGWLARALGVEGLQSADQLHLRQGTCTRRTIERQLKSAQVSSSPVKSSQVSSSQVTDRPVYEELGGADFIARDVDGGVGEGGHSGGEHQPWEHRHGH
jgi:hypothetical protein